MTENELEALASETAAKCEACERREPGSCFVPFTPYDHILSALRRAAGQWIPVGERLPDCNGQYWIYDGIVRLADFYETEFIEGWQTLKPSHWAGLSLPAPPAGEVKTK